MAKSSRVQICHGKFKGRHLSKQSGRIRPSSSLLKESLFNVISGNLEDFDLRNSCFWDLFCGSGAIGLEALSRGANKVVFLDVEISAILKNIQALNVGEDALVLKRNFRKLGENLKAYKEFPPQVVFADPPYSYWQEESFFNDLILSLEKLKSPHLFIEHPAEIKLQSHSNITKVWTRKYGNCCLSYFLPS